MVPELPDIVKEATDDTDSSEEEIVVYADDNTRMTADHNPLTLQNKTQAEADKVINWFSRNYMVCSSDKAKLLVVGTSMNRQIKLNEQDQDIYL